MSSDDELPEDYEEVGENGWEEEEEGQSEEDSDEEESIERKKYIEEETRKSCHDRIRYEFSKKATKLDEERVRQDPDAPFNPAVIYLYMFATEDLSTGTLNRALPDTRAIELSFLPKNAMDRLMQERKTRKQNHRKWWSHDFKSSHQITPGNGGVVYRLTLPTEHNTIMTYPDLNELEMLNSVDNSEMKHVCGVNCLSKMLVLGAGYNRRVIILCRATIAQLRFSGVSARLPSGIFTPFYSVDQLDKIKVYAYGDDDLKISPLTPPFYDVTRLDELRKSPGFTTDRYSIPLMPLKLSDWERINLITIEELEKSAESLRQKTVRIIAGSHDVTYTGKEARLLGVGTTDKAVLNEPALREADNQSGIQKLIRDADGKLYLAPKHQSIGSRTSTFTTKYTCTSQKIGYLRHSL